MILFKQMVFYLQAYCVRKENTGTLGRSMLVPTTASVPHSCHRIALCPAYSKQFGLASLCVARAELQEQFLQIPAQHK